MSCLTLWWCSATHPDFVNTYMRYIAFLLGPLYCTRSLLSAIIRDKRLITNNLSFFPLLMDNYDKKPKCWHCIKPSRVIFARFFRLLYMQTVSPSLTVVQKVWNVKLIIKVFRFQYGFSFFFFFFMIISWYYFFILSPGMYMYQNTFYPYILMHLSRSPQSFWGPSHWVSYTSCLTDLGKNEVFAVIKTIKQSIFHPIFFLIDRNIERIRVNCFDL